MSRLSNEVSSHPQCTVISQKFDKNHEKKAFQKQGQSAGIELKTELQKSLTSSLSEIVKYFQYNLFIGICVCKCTVISEKFDKNH